MLRGFLVIFCILLSQGGKSQTSFFAKPDSLNRTRIASVVSVIGAGWTTSTICLYQVWYADYPKSKFHTFNDAHNWLLMDKAGHFYTANKLSALTSDFFEWGGLKKRKSVLVGSGIGLGLQTTLEIMDGTSSEWGFSWSDMGFNTAGVLSFATQELLWEEQRFIFKFSYHPTQFAAIRPAVLGATFAEQFFKDYNGQTYWMSFSPASFMQSTKIPKWLCLSLGYSVNQKLVGDQEIYTDPTTGMTYYSQRELIFSLDVDFSKIPIKRKWLKTVVKQFNYVKIPFPALILSNGKLTGKGIYF